MRMVVALVVVVSPRAAVMMVLMVGIEVPVSVSLPFVVSCLVPFVAATGHSVLAIVAVLLFVLVVLIVAYGVIWK